MWRRLADLSRAGAEVLICVTTEHDEAVGRTRAEWPDAPILVGSDDTFNPKLNNVRKGLEAASRPVVALCDAGIDLDAPRARRGGRPAFRQGRAGAGAQGRRSAGELRGRDGVQLHQRPSGAFPDGGGPAGHAGRVRWRDHSHQGRAAAHRRPSAVSSTISPTTIRWCASVRDHLGQTTWLARVMPRLPVGGRRWQDVWRRQVRWGSTRLKLSPEVRALVLLEPAIGWLASGIALVVALLAAGVGTDLACPGGRTPYGCLVRRRGMVPRRPRPAVRSARLGCGIGARSAGATACRTGLARPQSHRLARHEPGGRLAARQGWHCRKTRMR